MWRVVAAGEGASLSRSQEWVRARWATSDAPRARRSTCQGGPRAQRGRCSCGLVLAQRAGDRSAVIAQVVSPPGLLGSVAPVSKALDPRSSSGSKPAEAARRGLAAWKVRGAARRVDGSARHSGGSSVSGTGSAAPCAHPPEIFATTAVASRSRGVTRPFLPASPEARPRRSQGGWPRGLWRVRRRPRPHGGTVSTEPLEAGAPSASREHTSRFVVCRSKPEASSWLLRRSRLGAEEGVGARRRPRTRVPIRTR